MSEADLQVLVCNYAEATSAHSDGARAYVLRVNGGDPDRPYLLARSRSGRWVRRYEARRRLRDLRPTTIPPEHPLYAALKREAVPAAGLARWSGL